MNFLRPLSLLLAAIIIFESTPSPNRLGADVTLLIHDDILESPHAYSGVLLLSAQSHGDAIKACQAVGEQLWAPELKTSNIQSDLDYLSYEGKYLATQQYCIVPTASGPRAINGEGKVATVSSKLCLPVLCTQTAPFSNLTFQDTSEQWQVAVHSNNEQITGFRDRVSFRFLGVRYAVQPERSAYSTPYVGSGGNASALEYGSVCIQYASPSAFGSEDCLFLSIWTPYLPNKSRSNSDLKPVMFNIHGGGFEADDGVTNGSYSFADTVTALEWIRANIKGFGGDPNRITVMGQSSGAIAVTALLASPKSIEKFAAGITQSYTVGDLGGTSYAHYYPISEVASAATAAILQA